VAPYPHIPKSTKSLLPGEFWPIRLPSGRYACGRVIALTPFDGVSPLRAFLAGILDWVGIAPPTSDSIAMRPCIYQCRIHIKAISRAGSAIVGLRKLDDDGIEPFVFKYLGFVQKGFTKIRRYDATTDRHLPPFSAAGPGFLDRKAAYLLEKTPNQLPDPTSRSVTPPAGAGRAPSVAADH